MKEFFVCLFYSRTKAILNFFRVYADEYQLDFLISFFKIFSEFQASLNLFKVIVKRTTTGTFALINSDTYQLH